MFRFWSSDPRGCERSLEAETLPTSPGAPTVPTLQDSSVRPSSTLPDGHTKRRRSSSLEDTGYYFSNQAPSKRAKVQDIALLSPQSLSTDCKEEDLAAREPLGACDLEDVKEVIQYQFGLEILLKHDELRLINQELAKCQVALEQLRRCHLIPYPVSCPTPAQMLDIINGKGPALQSRPGEPVPEWAPPFGVVDGPYARHYAKWLIPDPVFDGIQPESHTFPCPSRARSSAAESSRTTRNSLSDVASSGKGRSVRGMAGQKLHALSAGYSQPKDKHSPCILKRSDGQTVKLICIDCQRWDFSSTQGFINHCRIAHRRDFKSHEEAAVRCGHPIEVDETGGIVGEHKAAAAPPPSGLTHPYARSDSITEQQAYAGLRSRIRDSLELYRSGKLRGVESIPCAEGKERTAAATRKPTQFVGEPATPYLSQMLQKMEFKGNLAEHVSDAKTMMDLDEVFTPGEDAEDADTPGSLDHASSSAKSHAMTAARTPAVMRVPARAVVSPVPLPTVPRPASSKGLAPQLPFGAIPEGQTGTVESASYDDDMDIDMSPNTVASNNAPSLVSDDGEYDDSDDGSASETSDSIGAESVSDVAEINIAEENDGQDHGSPRPVRHHHRTSTTVKLGKDDNKHVTFVTPITGTGNPGKAKGRRKHNA